MCPAFKLFTSANERKNEKPKDNGFLKCCTATLTYNGRYYDSYTYFGVATGNYYCSLALQVLRDPNPQASLLKEAHIPADIATLMEDCSIVRP